MRGRWQCFGKYTNRLRFFFPSRCIKCTLAQLMPVSLLLATVILRCWCDDSWVVLPALKMNFMKVFIYSFWMQNGRSEEFKNLSFSSDIQSLFSADDCVNYVSISQRETRKYLNRLFTWSSYRILLQMMTTPQHAHGFPEKWSFQLV